MSDGRFLDLMVSKADTLRDRYGLELLLTGVADSSGAVLDAHGIDLPRCARTRAAAGAPATTGAARPE